MKNVLNKLIMAALVLGACRLAQATDIAYSGTFVGTEGLASTPGSSVSKNFTRDMNTTGDRISLQVTYSSYTVAVSTNFGSNNYVLNTPTITVVGNYFVTGQQVLYSTGTVALSGLTNQTTYYIGVVGANNNGVANTFVLSATSTGAVAGLGIVLASSSTAANRYTLAPLSFANGTGASGMQLQWSDDNANWTNATTGNYGLAISSVSFAAAGGTTLYDLGFIQYRYLRVKETAPSAGAVTYTVTDNERYSFKH